MIAITKGFAHFGSSYQSAPSTSGVLHEEFPEFPCLTQERVPTSQISWIKQQLLFHTPCPAGSPFSRLAWSVVWLLYGGLGLVSPGGCTEVLGQLGLFSSPCSLRAYSFFSGSRFQWAA